MLRLFSSRPNSRASSRPSSRNGNKPSLGTVLKTHKDVSVRLLLNSHGAVIMTQNRIDTGPADVSAAQYADGQLTGEVEINVARGSGRKRCRAIRIRLQQVARLHMGKERGWERDVLFERTIENRGAIILEEGVQR
jgi:hypothetical protein